VRRRVLGFHTMACGLWDPPALLRTAVRAGSTETSVRSRIRTSRDVVARVSASASPRALPFHRLCDGPAVVAWEFAQPAPRGGQDVGCSRCLERGSQPGRPSGEAGRGPRCGASVLLDFVGSAFGAIARRLGGRTRPRRLAYGWSDLMPLSDLVATRRPFVGCPAPRFSRAGRQRANLVRFQRYSSVRKPARSSCSTPRADRLPSSTRLRGTSSPPPSKPTACPPATREAAGGRTCGSSPPTSRPQAAPGARPPA
jgi:hypothetical protein